MEQLLEFNLLNKAATFSAVDMAAALGIAFVMGLFIFMVYKKTYSGVMYSQSFGISLIAMSMITSLVILAVSSNIITSLGMVGALSIVRFRTVIKDPLDLVYMFWAITGGIIVGAGLIPLALIGSVAIGLLLYVFTSRKTVDTPYVLIVNCANDDAEQRAAALIQEKTKRMLVKSKNVSQSGLELTAEVRLKEESTAFVNALLGVSGVENAVLVSYNGDYYL